MSNTEITPIVPANLGSKPATLRRYVVKVQEVFESTLIVTAFSPREAQLIAEDNFDPDFAGQELMSKVTSELPLRANDEAKGPRYVGDDYEVNYSDEETEENESL